MLKSFPLEKHQRHIKECRVGCICFKIKTIIRVCNQMSLRNSPDKVWNRKNREIRETTPRYYYERETTE